MCSHTPKHTHTQRTTHTDVRGPYRHDIHVCLEEADVWADRLGQSEDLLARVQICGKSTCNRLYLNNARVQSNGHVYSYHCTLACPQLPLHSSMSTATTAL